MLCNDDEKSCDTYNCPGFLKCSGVSNCVHPTEVCDGTSNCPYGDDERLCDIKHCPLGCQCLGYSAACHSKTSSFIPYIPMPILKLLSIRFPSMFIPNLRNLTTQSRLFILDMSNCFSRLTSLLVLKLRGNPLKYISDNSFKTTPILWLAISNTNMCKISGQWIEDLEALVGIDLRGLQIKSINLSPLRHLAGVKEIISEDIRLCCLLTDKGMCKTMDRKLFNCMCILPGKYLALVLLTTATLLLLWIGMSLAVSVTILYTNRPVYFSAVVFVMTGELLCNIYMLTIAAVDLYYGKQYVLAGTSWVNSVFCHGLSVAVSTGLSLSVMADSLITHLSYKVVTSMIFREHHFQRKVNVLLLSFILVTSIFVVVDTWMSFSKERRQRESLFDGILELWTEHNGFGSVVNHDYFHVDFTCSCIRNESAYVGTCVFHGKNGTSIFIWRPLLSTAIISSYKTHSAHSSFQVNPVFTSAIYRSAPSTGHCCPAGYTFDDTTSANNPWRN